MNKYNTKRPSRPEVEFVVFTGASGRRFGSPLHSRESACCSGACSTDALNFTSRSVALAITVRAKEAKCYAFASSRYQIARRIENSVLGRSDHPLAEKVRGISADNITLKKREGIIRVRES
jgi:hypothetical protein